MNDFLDRISKLSPKRLALLALEQHEQIQRSAALVHEPIAIVGMGCRLPGDADQPLAFWRLLAAGGDAIREVPPDRWDIDAWFDPDPDKPARMSARAGGFLSNVDQFDAGFFGIAPREALTMDPQQRLLLEVAWHALEDAGIAPDTLAGTAAGVFIGLCNNDHFQRLLSRGPESIDAYVASGNAHSVAAGRIAYCLGLQGPALAIDTACSSSLVALHLAVRSLRSGESSLALAGGVNLMCSPETTIALSRAHMLAPDGRCKTFDAAADGFSRGEGCGVLVLKRLSDAQREGDRVLAVIRGSAINQDGRSGGLTVPNGPAQEAVIGAALADAQLQAGDIDYVEAHGTGTSLGDPIEVRALANALAAGRPPAAPLYIGSVKTNIGHLESAAGIAGVIKVVLSLQHGSIPPHLHFKQPSPHIDWQLAPIEVTARNVPWQRGARARRAGVSSFGFSGTNAHVVLEEAPLLFAASRDGVPERPLHCLPLSARSPGSLARLAAALAAQLNDTTDLAALCYSAGTGRSHFIERAVVVAADVATALEALRALASDQSHPCLHRGTAEPGQASEVAFLFTGQGSQYVGMGRQLYDAAPVFREVIDRCAAQLGPDARGRTLLTVLFDESSAGPAAPIHATDWTQPALFALEMATVALWRSWGIEPAAVIGHSAGEYAAACAAGVFSLAEGLDLIAERGRLMHALPAGGSMAALFASAESVAPALAAHGDRIAIAAINAPDSVVISGDSDTVDAVLADFATRDVQGQRLFVSLAAHSPRVEPALDAIESCAARVTMHAPLLPVAWNLSGGESLPGGAPDARYWRRHLREPVRFGAGIGALHRQGYRVFLEVGPHPTLVALAQRSLPESDCVTLNSMRRSRDDWSEMLTSLAQLYVRGAPVDWAGFDRPYTRQRVDLPSYPFERASYWVTPEARAWSASPSPATAGLPLLGLRLPTAVPIFECLLTPSTLPCLGDHRVHGAVLVAGPVFLEMAQAAMRELHGNALRGIRDFAIREPLVLPDAGALVQLHLSDEANGSCHFTVYSRAVDGQGPWRRHASGRLLAIDANAAAAGANLTALTATQDSLGKAEACDAYYDVQLRGLSIELGAGFRSLVSAHCRAGEALAQIELPATAAADRVSWAHPALLDGALQAIGLAVPKTQGSETAYLLTGIERLDLCAALPPRLWAHARILNHRDVEPAEWQAEVTLRSLEGSVLGVIHGVSLRRATRDALMRAVGQEGNADHFYALSWESAPLGPVASAHLVAPREFDAALQDRFAALAERHGLAIYTQLLPELDRLSFEHILVALAALGFDATPGRRFQADAEVELLRVAARHRRLFLRLLAILAEEGVLRTHAGGFEVLASLPACQPEARYDALLARFNDCDGELRTLRRCGPELGRVLRGEQDPLQLLFPGGSFSEARKLYVESPFAQTYNRALAEALQSAIARLPADARLRILEIGAGTGGTTGYVLPLLPAGRSDYCFTDLSPMFLERAAEQFAAYPCMRHALLDIERDPLAQGFEAGRFDIIIAANVLHATADLRATLCHVRRLMAPGAQLLLLEGVAPERWIDLSFGLTEGWWRFNDVALRPEYPLIARDEWVELLRDLDFEDVATVPGTERMARESAQQALLVASSPAGGRRWAVAGAEPALGTALVERLRARGAAATLLSVEPSAAELPEGCDVVYLGGVELATLSLDAQAGPAAARRVCEQALRWQQVANVRHGRAWFVTRASQVVDTVALAPGAAWQAPLWGLGRGMSLENPAAWGGLIDLPVGTSDALADLLAHALVDADGEDQCAWREGGRSVLRMQRAAPPPRSTFAARPGSTYLVTGGFGGLGLVVAAWLVEQGATHIALLGRHVDMTGEAVASLQSAGATIIGVQADVADAASLDQALAHLQRSAPPLRGVVHAAAALNAVHVEDLQALELQSMLGPKLDGSVLLERATRDIGLDFLVLFSSTTALLGAAGLAHYAAANAFLDAFAIACDTPERRVLSINWGTWDVMRLASADDQRSYRAGGLLPMRAVDALDSLGRLLAATRAQVPSQSIVAKIDWSVLKPLHEVRRARPLLARLNEPLHAQDSERPSVDAGPSLAERLAAAPAGLRNELLVEFVQRAVADVLVLGEAKSVPVATGLFDLGMDSLMSVELKRRLERGSDRALPSTLTFNYPTVEALAAFLESLLVPKASVVVMATRTASNVSTEERAITSDLELDAMSDEQLEARLLARLEQER